MTVITHHQRSATFRRQQGLSRARSRSHTASTIRAMKPSPQQPPPKPVIQQTNDNLFVRAVVAVATESLRVIGIGSSSSSSSSSNSKNNRDTTTATSFPLPGSTTRPATGDITAILAALKEDFEERNYFITGILSDGIYDENCYFADPTVNFTGLELWKRNLKLLVPFLVQPSINLTSLEKIEDAAPAAQRGALLKADWRLRCGLRLPWSPYIDILGSTEYELAWPDENRIVKHVEFWNISPWEALVLIVTPAGDGNSSSSTTALK